MSVRNPRLYDYISKLAKRVNPDISLTGESAVELNNLNKYLLEMLMQKVNANVNRQSKKTATAKEVEYAVKLAFPMELRKHAISEGSKAIQTYEAAAKDRASQRKPGEQLKPVLKSSLANIVFPITRIENIMRELSTADRVSKGAPIYMAAVLEYITSEILELSWNFTVNNKKKRITPRHITLAVQDDAELKKLFAHVNFGGGVQESWRK